MTPDEKRAYLREIIASQKAAVRKWQAKRLLYTHSGKLQSYVDDSQWRAERAQRGLDEMLEIQERLSGEEEPVQGALL